MQLRSIPWHRTQKLEPLGLAIRCHRSCWSPRNARILALPFTSLAVSETRASSKSASAASTSPLCLLKQSRSSPASAIAMLVLPQPCTHALSVPAQVCNRCHGLTAAARLAAGTGAAPAERVLAQHFLQVSSGKHGLGGPLHVYRSAAAVHAKAHAPTHRRCMQAGCKHGSYRQTW